MSKKRKPRRRTVHSMTSEFRDGSVIACSPIRKPKMKHSRDIDCDLDGVCHETQYSATEWHQWDDTQRVRVTTVLANRLNTRRALREIVQPSLEAIHASIAHLQTQLDRIEARLNTLK